MTDERLEKPTCETCVYWEFKCEETDGESQSYGRMGHCCIRSVEDDDFPERFDTEFCGEHPDFETWLLQERGCVYDSEGREQC
jgi:hypothetical protein